MARKAKTLSVNWKPPQILWILAIAVVLLLVGLFVIAPKSEEQIESEVDEKLIAYTELYLGLTNVTVKSKTLKDGVWTANIGATERFGQINMDILMYASNFSVFKIYESITPPDRPATVMDIPGKVSCSFGGLITADIYIDPYDRWSRIYDPFITNFTKTFENTVRPQYRIIPTYSFEAMKEAGNEALHAFRYLACAKKDQNAFLSLKSCIYEKYADTNQFLNESEVKKCAESAGLNVPEVESCSVEGAITELSIDQRFGETFLPEPITPSIVIDCKYRTFPSFIDRVFCYLYPGDAACKLL